MFGSWVSKVLCLIPDSFPPWVWAIKEPGWCTRNFRSCSYPFGHWSASEHSLLPVRLSLFSFCTDLLLLSEEELVHRCHHVSVHLLVQPLLSLPCWVQVWVGNYTKLGFILRERGLGPLRNMTGQLRPCLCYALPWGVDTCFYQTGRQFMLFVWM